MNEEQMPIGIDVSKHSLDVAVQVYGKLLHKRGANTPAG